MNDECLTIKHFVPLSSRSCALVWCKAGTWNSFDVVACVQSPCLDMWMYISDMDMYKKIVIYGYILKVLSGLINFQTTTINV